MPEVITIGESMAVYAPVRAGRLRYQREYLLGMAGAESNTAIGVQKLGHTAGWVSLLGEDELGQFVRNTVRAEGVDTSRVQLREGARTGLMIKEMTPQETRVYYYRDGSAFQGIRAEDIDADYIKSAKIVHLTGITPVLSASCLRTAKAAAALAAQGGAMLSFDPNIRRKLWGSADYTAVITELMNAADIVLVGLDEAQALLGVQDAESIAHRLMEEGGASAVAIKNGKDGAWVADRSGFFHIPPYPCVCIDPVGAGDAFNAAFLVGLLEKKSIQECGKMGAIAGALATQTIGDTEGLPERVEMDALLGGTRQIYR